MKRDAIYSCPIEATLAIIGGKWKSVILWNLIRKRMRFSELRRYMPNITQKMLTKQLRELEDDGLVKREVFAEVPVRVEYSATKRATELRETLDQLCIWGRKHFQKNA